MAIEKIGKRIKQTIVRTLERLISKYGLNEVRLVTNKYFTREREKTKLEKEVKEKEAELLKMKRKLGA
jgi:wobble nucleotide-excising tRNase